MLSCFDMLKRRKKMENKEYFEEIEILIDRLKDIEKEIFDLALDVEKDYSAEEAQQISTLIFMIWKSADRYKRTMKKIEDMEDERFKQCIDKVDGLKIIGDKV